MDLASKIFIAGHRGMVGSAIIKNLVNRGYNNLVFRTHDELDLIDQNAVYNFFTTEQPDYVILAAAKVGGIFANNTYRADFIYENLMIQNNVIHQSYLSKVKKLLFLGSTCIYPKDAPQPIKENSLLSSPLEYTNEPYAVAKIAGIKMCESYNLQYGTNFISVMPTNLYGPNDNFDLETSHVLPALIRKIHLARCLETDNFEAIKKDLDKNPIQGLTGNPKKLQLLSILKKYGVTKKEVEIWGSGKPKREFLWSEDMADACIFLLENKGSESTISSKKIEIRNTQINIGTGIDISIKALAESIKNCIGYNGGFKFNLSKPDGVMRKLTDVSKLHQLGWEHTVSLEQGISKIYSCYTNK
jgi:GDP-L-fucose synthase